MTQMKTASTEKQPGYIHVNRPVLSEKQYEDKYRRKTDTERKGRLKQTLRKQWQTCCSREALISTLLNLLPCITVLRTYKVREYLLGDVIAGLSVGILHVAQGMGWALLVTLAPIYGMYASFFPVMIFFLFGSARHASYGAMALVALLVGNVVNREYDIINQTGDSNTTASTLNATFSKQPTAEEYEIRAGIAMSVSLMAGVIQIAMSFVRLGFLSTYLSPAFVGGLMTGAALHIASSQVKYVFGLNLPRYQGILYLPKTYASVFENISDANWLAVIMALTTFVVVVLVQVLVNERYGSKLVAPLPIELFMLITGTVLAYFFKLDETYNIAIMGPIPNEIPPPRIPPMTAWPNYITDAFVIALVSYVVSMSTTKLFMKKHNYTVDFNWELLAYGLANTGGAFLNSFTNAVAPPRCMLYENAGGKTQIAHLISSIFVCFAILFISPYLRTLPNCVLAGVIVAALMGFFKQFKDLKPLWRSNKYDFATWIVSFLSTFLWDIMHGLIIGLAFSLFTVIVRTQFSQAHLLDNRHQVDIFEGQGRDEEGMDFSDIRVFSFNGPLYFANVDRFKAILQNKTKGPPKTDKVPSSHKTMHFINGDATQLAQKQTNSNGGTQMTNYRDHKTSLLPHQDDATEVNIIDPYKPLTLDPYKPSTVIIDMSAVCFIDTAGVSALTQARDDFSSCDVSLLFAACRSNVLSSLEQSDFFEIVPKSQFFVTLQDAYIVAMTGNQSVQILHTVDKITTV